MLVSNTSTASARAQGEDGGGVSFGIGVQRNGLRADPDAEVDLGAGWGDDLAIADDPRAVRLRAGDVGRVLLGLSQRRAPEGSAPPPAGRRADAGLSETCFETYFESYLKTFPFSSFDFFHHATLVEAISWRFSGRDFAAVLILFSISNRAWRKHSVHQGDQFSLRKGRQHYADITVL